MTDEQKKVFWGGNSFFNYEMNFAETDTVIDCEQIQSESVQITESICEEEELVLGGCIASCCEFDVSGMTDTELAGLQFAVTLSDLEGRVSLPMGVYRVDTAKREDDKDYKHIIGYDALYDASVDVSGWYNSLFPDEGSRVTIGDMRCSLLEHLGMSYVKQSLANDSLEVGKTIEPEALAGTDVLKAICTVNGAFGKINREGLFEEIYPGNPALFPDESLYPSEDLFPEDTFEYLGSGDKEAPEYRDVQYEEYTTKPITCVSIKSDDTDTDITAGKDFSNPYVISGNFLLYGLEVNTLRNVADEILRKISGIIYRPCTVSLCGLPYVETGTAFALEKRTDIVESIVFTRTLTGIQELIDTFEAKGSELRMNEVMPDLEIIRIHNKLLNIQKNVDAVSVEMKDMEKGMSSKIEQTAESITSTVAGAQKVWDEADWSGKITLYGYGEPADTEDIAWGTYYLDQITGILYSLATNAAGVRYWANVAQLQTISSTIQTQIAQTEDSIIQEVSQTYETKDDAGNTKKDLFSRIAQTLQRIALEINNGDKTAGIVITMINEDGTTSNVSGTIDMTGLVTFKNLENSGETTINGANIITGTVSCDTLNGGTINGQTIKGGSISGTRIIGVVIEGSNVITANQFYEIYGSTPVTLIKNAWVLDDNGKHKNTTGSYNIPSIEYCNAAYAKASDYRIKKNTKPLPKNIDKVFDSLRPIEYEFKDTITAWKGRHFGELSQRIDKVMRENGIKPDEYALTGTREIDEGMGEEPYCIDNKVHYINHDEVTWLCVDQIQKLKKQQEIMKQEQETMRKAMEEMKSEMELLRSRFAEMEETNVR